MTKPAQSRRALSCLLTGLVILSVYPDPAGAAEPISVERYDSLPQRLEAYIAALNAADFEKMFAFFDDGVTESYRSRRSEGEDRALYEFLTSDLGQLEIRTIRRESDEKVTLIAHSAAKDTPVRFLFDIKDERIDGVAIRLGAPPGETHTLLNLPRSIDDSMLADRLDKQLQALAAKRKFSGVVLLARQGKPFFHKAYGLANRDSGAPNTISTAFDTGSITKLMTRIAVAQLLQAGKLSLDGRINDYLPDYPNGEVARQVTVRQLLDHSSGLGDIFNARWESASKERYVTPRDFFDLFVNDPLRFAPGSSRSYSNAGFVVLGAIVEAAAGKSFSEYLEANIFSPAGMTRSGLEKRDGTNPAFAVGYASTGPGGSLVDNLDMLPLQGSPAGSSMHTAEDLLKLDSALRDGRLLDPNWTAWVYTSDGVREDAGYAIGVAGGAPGVSAGLESNGTVTVIVLSNFDPPTGEALARELYQALETDS